MRKALHAVAAAANVDLRRWISRVCECALYMREKGRGAIRKRRATRAAAHGSREDLMRMRVYLVCRREERGKEETL